MSKNSKLAKILREIAFSLQTEEEKESEPNAILKLDYIEQQMKYKFALI